MAISFLMLAALLLLLFPVFTVELAGKRDLFGQAGYEVFLDPPLKTSVYDFFDVIVLAKNTAGAPIQISSASIKWASSEGYEALHVKDFTFPIDDARHRYRIPVGEEKEWTKGSVHSFLIETREIEGMEIILSKVSLKRRMPMAIDAHLNQWAASFFGLRGMDAYWIPAIILMFYLMIAGSAYIKIFKPAAIDFPIFASFLFLSVLLFFSFFFLRSQLITVKSHFLSQKDTVKSQGIEYTYAGFLNFRQFLGWVDETLDPKEDILFLVRGEPVYIMSEAAYHLYPRKLEFINSSRPYSQILEDIDSRKDARILIAMTAEDLMLVRNLKGLEFVDRYRQNAGFILRIDR